MKPRLTHLCDWALPSWEVRVVHEASGARGGARPAPAGGKAVGLDVLLRKRGVLWLCGVTEVVNGGTRAQW